LSEALFRKKVTKESFSEKGYLICDLSNICMWTFNQGYASSIHTESKNISGGYVMFIYWTSIESYHLYCRFYRNSLQQLLSL
jgi:hypothetical protein